MSSYTDDSAPLLQVNAHFPVESPSSLLQREVIIQFLVADVFTFQRQIVFSVLHAVSKNQVVRQLSGHHIVVLVGSNMRRVVGKAMQILVVVGHRQRVAFAPAVVPIEVDVGVGKQIRGVRHSLFIVDVGSCRPHCSFHIVAHIHLREVASYAQPSTVGIAQ